MRGGVENQKHQRGSRAGERGYILALLLGICTIMAIHLQRAIPAVHAEVQRELEAELVYRGEHIAKGIRRFKEKRGAYPSKLDQLVKTRPRFVRKLYGDPMNHDGNWILVLAVQGPKSGDISGLPIVGIHSSSQQDSFRSYHRKTIYSDWIFSSTDDLFGIPGGAQESMPGGPLTNPADKSGIPEAPLDGKFKR